MDKDITAHAFRDKRTLEIYGPELFESVRHVLRAIKSTPNVTSFTIHLYKPSEFGYGGPYIVSAKINNEPDIHEKTFMSGLSQTDAMWAIRDYLASLGFKAPMISELRGREEIDVFF